MAPLYSAVCKDLRWTVDAALLARMEEANKVTIVYVISGRP
jgi:hypothetical protein